MYLSGPAIHHWQMDVQRDAPVFDNPLIKRINTYWRFKWIAELITAMIHFHTPN